MNVMPLDRTRLQCKDGESRSRKIATRQMGARARLGLNALMAMCLVYVSLFMGPAMAVEPLYVYEADAQPDQVIALSHSTVADQLQWQPRPHFSRRGYGWSGPQLSYRDRASGQIILSRSGEDAGSILNPERINLADSEQSNRFAGGCAASRYLDNGLVEWSRRLEVIPPVFPTNDGDCQSIAESSEWRWFKTGDALRLIAADGQIKVTVTGNDFSYFDVKAANMLADTATLLAITRDNTSGPLKLQVLNEGGLVRSIALPETVSAVLHSTLLADPNGGWRILSSLQTGAQAWLQISADLTATNLTPLQQPILGLNSFGEPSLANRIIELRWLDAKRLLATVELGEADHPYSFRVVEVDTEGRVRTLVVGAPYEVPQRMYALPSQSGVKRAVLATRLVPENHPPLTPVTLTLRLFRDSDIVYQRSLSASHQHQLTAIGDSGELLLAEQQDDIVKVSLLSATGTLLESREMGLPGERQSEFLRFAADGHFRLRWITVGNTAKRRITKHALDGRRVWGVDVAPILAATFRADLNEACFVNAVGSPVLSCHSNANGQLIDTRAIRCSDDFRNESETRRGAISEVCGQSAGSSISLAEQVVLSARPEQRFSNGDVLWSDGVTVHRYAANGTLLNQFGTGSLTQAKTSSETPLRFASDGSYLFARLETDAGQNGLALYRIDRAGRVQWRHFERGALLKDTTLPPGLSTVIRLRPMELVGTQVALELFTFDAAQRHRRLFLYVRLSDGHVTWKTDFDAYYSGAVKFPDGDRLIAVSGGLIQSLGELGQVRAQYHIESPIPINAPVGIGDEDPSFDQIRLENGRINIAGYVYPDPETLPAIRLDQSVLDGSWNLGRESSVVGRGIELDYLEHANLLFGVWHLAAPNSDWRESDLRWLTLAGVVSNAADVVDLGIYESTGGAFARTPGAVTARVGTASIRLETCGSGTFTAEFDRGAYAGTRLRLPFNREQPWSTECAAINEAPLPLPTIRRFGFDSRQSGAYVVPGIEGQGLIVQVRPDLGPQGQFSAIWFTADPDQASDDPSGQFWLKLEGPLQSTSTGKVQATMLRLNGVDPLIPASDTSFYAHRVSRTPVGTAWLEFQGCNRATLRYQFADTDLAGRFRAKAGELPIQGFGTCPE